MLHISQLYDKLLQWNNIDYGQTVEVSIFVQFIHGASPEKVYAPLDDEERPLDILPALQTQQQARKSGREPTKHPKSPTQKHRGA